MVSGLLGQKYCGQMDAQRDVLLCHRLVMVVYDDTGYLLRAIRHAPCAMRPPPCVLRIQNGISEGLDTAKALHRAEPFTGPSPS